MIIKPNKSQWKFDRSLHLEYFNARYTFEFEENNKILLRKVNFAFMIQNPSLDCSYVIFNFWLNSCELRSYKIVLIKRSVYSEMQFQGSRPSLESSVCGRCTKKRSRKVLYKKIPTFCKLLIISGDFLKITLDFQ